MRGGLAGFADARAERSPSQLAELSGLYLGVNVSARLKPLPTLNSFFPIHSEKATLLSTTRQDEFVLEPQQFEVHRGRKKI